VPLHELSRVPPTQLTGRSSLLLGRQRRPFADVQRAQSHRPPRSLIQAEEGSWSFARASLFMAGPVYPCSYRVEGVHSWGLGLSKPPCFRVVAMNSEVQGPPTKLVVDIRH
jgi:hypothetical protein